MDPFLGQIVLFAGNFAPRGWALCAGQLLPISQNDALFSILGTMYGGDGRTTFGLPDLRGRTAIGTGNGPGLSPYREGQRGGIEHVILNITEIPSHIHTVTGDITIGANNQPADISTPTPGSSIAQPGSIVSRAFTGTLGFNNATANIPLAGGSLSNATTRPTGGNLPHENRQPFTVINHIIALQGVYPSRS